MTLIKGGSGPIKLPLKPGEAIWFDLIAGKVYVGPIIGPIEGRG